MFSSPPPSPGINSYTLFPRRRRRLSPVPHLQLVSSFLHPGPACLFGGAFFFFIQRIQALRPYPPLSQVFDAPLSTPSTAHDAAAVAHLTTSGSPCTKPQFGEHPDRESPRRQIDGPLKSNHKPPRYCTQRVDLTSQASESFCFRRKPPYSSRRSMYAPRSGLG